MKRGIRIIGWSILAITCVWGSACRQSSTTECYPGKSLPIKEIETTESKYLPKKIVREDLKRTDLEDDAITWDELQRLKAEAGFADRWAVEVFPPDAQVVNIANIRHLFLLPGPPDYAWSSERDA